MSGMFLGSAVPAHIAIDGDAAGYGWFVDATPGDDAEFGNGSGTLLYTFGSQLPAGHIDLLTTVMHELGHQLGLGDSYDAADRADLMFGQITTGERRLPGAHEADNAVAGSIEHEEFAVGPLAIGTLPTGKSVTITFDATVDPQSDKLITNPVNQGSVTTSDQGSTTTNIVTTALDTLVLGNLVYNDVNHNSIFDAGDSGINGVTLTLYTDANNDGNVDDVGETVAHVTTDPSGLYSFTGLAPGDYFVQVDASQFHRRRRAGGLQECLAHRCSRSRRQYQQRQ